MTAPMEAIERLLIENECQKLILTYSELYDQGHWEALSDLFTVDALFISQLAPKDLLISRFAILENYRSTAKRVTQHVTTNIYIEVESDTKARSRSRILYSSNTESLLNTSLEKGHKEMRVGYFEDRLVLKETGWKFAERKGSRVFAKYSRP